MPYVLRLPLSILAGLACAIPASAANGHRHRVTVTMNAQNGSGEDGTATLTQTPTASGRRSLKNAPAAAISPRTSIRAPARTSTRRRSIPLTSLANGVSRTVLKGESLHQLTSGTFAINVHKSTSDLGTYVSCGDIKTS